MKILLESKIRSLDDGYCWLPILSVRPTPYQNRNNNYVLLLGAAVKMVSF